jgi:hypothetical protein
MYTVEIKDPNGKIVAILEVEWPSDKPSGLVRLISDTLDEADETGE